MACVEELIPTLECRPESAALIRWTVDKLVGLVTDCNRVGVRCVEKVLQCLTPVIDYTSAQNPTTDVICM